MNSTTPDIDFDDPSTLPLWFIKGEIAGYINSTLITFLLMGGYTVAFIATIYMYISSKATRPLLVLGTLSAMYISTCIWFAIQWYQAYISFGESDDLEAVFEGVFSSPDWNWLSSDIAQNAPAVLADILLIWRCFHVWNKSYRWILLPSFLWLCETMLFFIGTIYNIITRDETSNSVYTTSNSIESAFVFTSAVTSLMTTIFISWRIFSIVRLTDFPQRKFKYVLDIVVQSSAIYSISLIIIGVYDTAIPLTDDLNTTLTGDNIIGYMGSICFVLISLMPTLMVARVAMLPDINATVVSASKRSKINFATRKVGSSMNSDDWNDIV